MQRIPHGWEKPYMKFKWDKKYLYGGVTAFLVIIASISFFLILSRIGSVVKGLEFILGILTPIFYGLIIAYLLQPVMSFFERHCVRILEKRLSKQKPRRIRKISRCTSIFITMMLALLMVVGLFSLVIPQLISSLTGIIQNLPSYLNNSNDWLIQVLSDNPDLAGFVNDFITRLTNYMESWLQNDLLPQVNNIVSEVTSGVLGILNLVKNILIGIIVSIYVLYSKDSFAAQSKKLVYSIMRPAHANSFIGTIRHTHKVFGGFITGKLLDSLIIGMLCFICMNIFKMPYPLLISVIIGVTNVIPFFGPFIGAIPSAIIILLVEPITCLYFIILILVIQQFDGNILGPKILGGSTGISCFWVIFAILVGGGLLGFTGMIIGVPFFAVIYAGIKAMCIHALKEKQLPVETSEYENLDYIDETTGEPVSSENN